MMDVKIAAAEMLQLVIEAPMWVHLAGAKKNGLTRLHITHLLDAIIDGTVTGDKAHRWLAWSQCAYVSFGGGTLEQVKEVNHNA